MTTINPTAALILARHIAAPFAVPASRYVPAPHGKATTLCFTPRVRDSAVIIPGTLDG